MNYKAVMGAENRARFWFLSEQEQKGVIIWSASDGCIAGAYSGDRNLRWNLMIQILVAASVKV